MEALFKHRIKSLTILLVLFSLVFILFACVPVIQQGVKKQPIAILHIGPIGDFGWTYEAHLGARRMAKELPYIEILERVEACGPDTKEILKEYAEDGTRIIFCQIDPIIVND